MFSPEMWSQFQQLLDKGALTTNGCEGYNSAFAGHYLAINLIVFFSSYLGLIQTYDRLQ